MSAATTRKSLESAAARKSKSCALRVRPCAQTTAGAEAAGAAESVLKTDPGNQQAIRLRYNACLALGDADRLFDALVGLTAVEPVVASKGLLKLAFDAYDANDTVRAKRRFLKVLEFEPNQPLDPTKDKRISGAFYAVAPAPDGSVWGTVLGFPGSVVRLVPGANPSETAIAENYELPWNNPAAKVQGYSPRGGDIDRNGVYWAALASGHMASFDRRKCKGGAQRPERDRPALPGGVDAVSRAAAAVQGRHGQRQRRRQLLHLGGSVRHVRSGTERADQHGQRG